MVIGEETIVPRGIQKGVTTPMDPETLKREEKRIPDQIERNDEAGTPELPVNDEEKEPARETLADFMPPEDFYWTLDGDAEGEPIIDAPVEPEPEIDQVAVRDTIPNTPPVKEKPRVDPTPDINITPEPDRSPGAPPSGPPGFPGPDEPVPDPTSARH